MTPGCNRKSHIFRIFAPETHKTFHPSVRQHKHIPIIFTYVKTRITATLPGVPARTVCQCAGYLLHHQGRTGLLAHFERTIYRQPGHASYAGNAYLCAQLPARHRTNPPVGQGLQEGAVVTATRHGGVQRIHRPLHVVTRLCPPDGLLLADCGIARGLCHPGLRREPRSGGQRRDARRRSIRQRPVAHHQEGVRTDEGLFRHIAHAVGMPHLAAHVRQHRGSA